MKLYTKTVCPRCLWIKSEIQRSGHQVEIINMDHDKAARERLARAGIKSVPVLEAEGRYWIDSDDMLKVLGAGSVRGGSQ